jgi:SOS-response transcriptional repressor LexA
MKPITPSTSNVPTVPRRQFGNILRKIRKVRGLSIYELAEKANVDAGYISRLENAHRNPPSPKVLQRFAEALSVRVDILMLAAGYLEYDSSGKVMSEEEIIKKVEDEITKLRPTGQAIPETGSTVKTRSDIQDILRQLEEMKHNLLDAIKEGPTFEIPVLGRIPAGFPVGVEEYAIGKLPVERTGLPNDPDLFALRVSGDSLKDAGVMEGDYVVISPMLKNALDQGTICAVRLEDDEVTLKKVYHTGEGVVLRAANPEYKDILQTTVRIIGKVVRLVRQF